MEAADRVRFTIEFEGGADCGGTARVHAFDLHGTKSEVSAQCKELGPSGSCLQDGRLQWLVPDNQSVKVHPLQKKWVDSIEVTADVANNMFFTARLFTTKEDRYSMVQHADGSTRYATFAARDDVDVEMGDHFKFLPGQEVLVKIKNVGNRVFKASFNIQGGAEKPTTSAAPGMGLAQFFAASMIAEGRSLAEMEATAAREAEEFAAFKAAVEEGKPPSEIMKFDYEALAALLKSKEGLVTSGELQLLCNTMLEGVLHEGTLKALFMSLQIGPLMASIKTLSADNYARLAPILPYASETEFRKALEEKIMEKTKPVLQPHIDSSVNLWLKSDLSFRFKLLKSWSDFFQANGYGVDDSTVKSFYFSKMVLLFRNQWQGDWVGEILAPWANPSDQDFTQKFQAAVEDGFKEIINGI